MEPIITKISYTYKKQESPVFVLNTDDIPVLKDRIHDVQLIQFGPHGVGGNHLHRRTEWFIAFGQLWFYWLDHKGVVHKREMFIHDGLLLFEVPSRLPHAIVNHTTSETGFVYELSNEKMSEVVKVSLIEADNIS